MSNALREIIAHFGFDFDKGKAEEAEKHIHGIKVHSEEAAGGVTGLIEAFKVVAGLEIFRLTKEFTEALSEQAVEIKHASDATGVSTDQLQEWQFGAKQAGVDSQEFTMALRRLSSALAGGKDELGSQGPVLAKLGIHTGKAKDAVKSLSDALPRIADHFAEMADGPAKAALAQELFGRQGARLIPILNRGAEGLQELHKEFQELGGGFSSEAIERAEEFHHAMVRLDATFDSFKSQLAVAVLPRVATLLEYLTDGVRWITEFAKETTALESAVGSVATALAITLGGALAPFITGALKFVAIYLAVDDLKGFLAGQDSEIGALLDAWFGEGTADTVREWVMSAVDYFTEGFADIRATFPVFANAFRGVIDELNVIFDQFVLDAETKWNNLVESLGLKDSFKIDTTSRAAQLGADKTAANAHADNQFAAERELRQFNRDATPTSNAISTATSPVVAPTHETHWNMVTNAPQISITVPPGTPERVTRDIAKQTREALHETHRAALQALENRTGG